MQTRVKRSILNKVGNLLFCNDKLYTGIVFFQEENDLLKANFVEKGTIFNKYLPFCLPDNIDHDVQIKDANNIDIDGEIATLNNGEIYTGVAIWFDDNGYSYAEDYYEDGVLASDITWNKDMSVKSFHLDHGFISENGELKNGIFSNYGLSSYLFFRFDSKGNVKYARIDQKILKFKDFNFLKFSPIKDINDIFEWNFSEDLTLSDDYFDNDFILRILSDKKLNSIKKIDFYNTNVHDFGFVFNLDNIEILSIEISENYLKIYDIKYSSFNRYLIDILEKMKKEKNKNFKIILNNMELSKK